MIEAGKIYRIKASGPNDPHGGHYFLVSEEKKFKKFGYDVFYGICSCGVMDFEHELDLLEIRQTRKLKLQFAMIMLTLEQ